MVTQLSPAYESLWRHKQIQATNCIIFASGHVFPPQPRSDLSSKLVLAGTILGTSMSVRLWEFGMLGHNLLIKIMLRASSNYCY